MIEEVISSIIDAENRARDLVLEAEKGGEQLLSATEQKIEERRHLEEKNNKKFFSEEMQAADREADILKKEQISAFKKQVDGQIAVGTKNAEKAIKFILESVK